MMDVEPFIPSEKIISEVRKVVKGNSKVYYYTNPEFFVIDYGFGLEFYKKKI